MKKYPFILYLILSSLRSIAQNELSYNNAIGSFTKYYNTGHADSLFDILSPEFKTAFPLPKLVGLFGNLKAQLGSLNNYSLLSSDAKEAVYKSSFQNAIMAIHISLTKDNLIGGLFIGKYDPKEYSPDPLVPEFPFELATATGTISGTITFPSDVSTKVPIVLIIAGSGPTNRNGNSPALGINPFTYKLLADFLCKEKIATLRYDKRGVGKSTTSKTESDLRFDDFVEDAANIINRLRDDGRFSKVIVMGHSEGSLIGMLAIEHSPASGFISVAGPSESVDKLLAKQFETAPKALQAKLGIVMASLRNGKVDSDVDSSLYALVRPSVQPYLISWMKYAPQAEIKKISVPVLILQGGNDIQVDPLNAQALKMAEPAAQLQIIKGMNHILKQAPENRDQNIATYYNSSLPLDTQFVKAVTDFVNKVR
jgi:alpha-beta hydrolase superfamily lysophospholipase